MEKMKMKMKVGEVKIQAEDVKNDDDEGKK